MNNCNKCEYPFKTLWRCKYGHHKEWVSICYNCIKEIRFVNVRFISQIENIKRMIRCRLKLSNLELFMYHTNQSMRWFDIMSKNFKVFLAVISFFVLLKGYIFFNINPSLYLNPMGFWPKFFPKINKLFSYY